MLLITTPIFRFLHTNLDFFELLTDFYHWVLNKMKSKLIINHVVMSKTSRNSVRYTTHRRTDRRSADCQSRSFRRDEVVRIRILCQ